MYNLMEAKKLILLSYLWLYVTGVFAQEEDEEDWKRLWSNKYKERDTIPNDWEMSGEFEGDILNQDGSEDDSEIAERNIRLKRLWPKGIVPYEFSSTFDFSNEEKKHLRNVMTELQNVIVYYKKREPFRDFCRIEFIPKERFPDPELGLPEAKHWVEITKPNKFSCSSYVGRKKEEGGQPLQLSSECFKNNSTLIHELLHTLGFGHQHSAHNRNQYVNVLYGNIQHDYMKNFKKRSSKEYTSYAEDYDFESIMHFSPFAYARKNNKGRIVGPTIQALDPNIIIKKRNIMSGSDRWKLKNMYCH